MHLNGNPQGVVTDQVWSVRRAKRGKSASLVSELHDRMEVKLSTSFPQYRQGVDNSIMPSQEVTVKAPWSSSSFTSSVTPQGEATVNILVNSFRCFSMPVSNSVNFLNTKSTSATKTYWQIVQVARENVCSPPWVALCWSKFRGGAGGEPISGSSFRAAIGSALVIAQSFKSPKNGCTMPKSNTAFTKSINLLNEQFSCSTGTSISKVKYKIHSLWYSMPWKSQQDCLYVHRLSIGELDMDIFLSPVTWIILLLQIKNKANVIRM